jgi:thiol-disulfide isomerase/thioredoxin
VHISYFTASLVFILMTLLGGGPVAESARANQAAETTEAQAFTLDTFQAATAQMTDEAEFSALCRKYAAKATDLDVVRAVQDRWHEVEAEAALAYFKELRKQDPESPTAVYLYGRIAEDPLEKIELGRKVIDIDPEFTYGYRLVLYTYVEHLFQAQASAEEQALLAEELTTDAPLFTQLVRMQPDEAYSLDYLFDYQDYSGDYEAALETLDAAKDLQAAWAGGTTYAYIYAKLGRFTEARQAIEDQAADMVAAGHLTEEESGQYVDHYYDYYLRKAGAYAGLIEHYQSDPDYGEDPDALFAVSSLYCMLDNKVMAFGNLKQAADQGFDSLERLNKSEDLVSLHDDPRWDGLSETVAKNWVAGSKKRKEETLAAKISKPAPVWNLKDVTGNEVALTSLRGEIVILDFWATWCSPCWMAMPVLSNWLREQTPEGVHVFSINVWEPNPIGAKKYMAENNYAMTLLFGDEGVAESYEIKGIPYICAIDAAGNIRFEEKGYEEGLSEKLSWWVTELQGEGDGVN